MLMKFQKYTFRGKKEKAPGGTNMEGRMLSERNIEMFHQHLLYEEKSVNTIEKYLRDHISYSTA